MAYKTKAERLATEAAKVLYRLEPERALSQFRQLPPRIVAHMVNNIGDPQPEPRWTPGEWFAAACYRVSQALQEGRRNG